MTAQLIAIVPKIFPACGEGGRAQRGGGGVRAQRPRQRSAPSPQAGRICSLEPRFPVRRRGSTGSPLTDEGEYRHPERQFQPLLFRGGDSRGGGDASASLASANKDGAAAVVTLIKKDRASPRETTPTPPLKRRGLCELITELPLVVSLSNHAYRREAPFDKLRANGNSLVRCSGLSGHLRLLAMKTVGQNGSHCCFLLNFI